MKKFFIPALFTILMALPLKAQLLENASRSLFSDVKAYRVGDNITVAILEETEAGNAASANESSATSVGVSGSVSVNNNRSDVSASLNTNNNFRGRGENTRNERLRTRLSAKVVGVDANGNLQIEAKRTTKINGEQQTITLTGIVRPVDVQADNSVFSYNIADLSLVYEGEGNITKMQEPGLISRFLRILF